MHIHQLIHKHEMFQGYNSERELIISIANTLANSKGLRRTSVSGPFHIAAANHKTGERTGEVLETFTIWKEYEEAEDIEGYTVRMARGIHTSQETKRVGSWAVVPPYLDASDPARIAVCLLDEINNEMLYRSEHRTMNFTIHRVTILPAREMPVWSSYEI